MYLDENLVTNSFKPAERLLINNERLFTLTKMVEIRSEVTE